MNTFLLKKIIVAVAIACLPAFVFAQSAVQTLKVGDYTIEYDKTLEADTNSNGKNDRTSYYLKDQLVFTAYDENEDGKQDLWFRFKNGDAVDLELADKNADGKPDMITEVDAQEKAEVIYDADADGGSSFKTFFFIAIAIVATAAVYFGRTFLIKQLSAFKGKVSIAKPEKEKEN
ncbi:MAG: hypothetical protein AAB630_00665 [Patescibacteria group bacterium]